MSTPTLLSTKINGDTDPSASVCRSKIHSLVLTFSADVTISPGAFALSTSYGTPRTLTSATGGGILVSSVGPVVTLTFDPAHPHVDYGSLSDGDWSLSRDETKITSPPPVVHHIRRLFGDTDGNGRINGTDYDAMISAYLSQPEDSNYDPRLDFDGVNGIDADDYIKFADRFGANLDG